MNLTPPCVPWYFPRSDISKARLCTPWESLTFREKMDETPDDQCDKCLPDCSTTLYHTSITAAPFRKCGFKNLGVSYLCNFERDLKPPIWGQSVIDQYKKEANILPDFIKKSVGTNKRQYAGKIKIYCDGGSAEIEFTQLSSF